MAIALNVGIEGISYQAQNTAQKTDFPRQKVNLPISASIPSHLDYVFELYTSERTLENNLAPGIPDKRVVVPADYARLFEEVHNVSNQYTPQNDHDRQVVAAAQVLFNMMKEDFQSFSTGRNALIQG